MNRINRKQLILKKLQSTSTCSISTLAEELHVSSMTIRRDINALESNGIVTLENGFVVLNSGSLFEFNISQKQTIYLEEKKRIAKKALEFINDGDSIFLDAGTTPNQLASLLNSKKNVFVLTHSLLVANSVANMNNIRIVMCPGEFRQASSAYMGPLTNEFVSQFQIDTLFLGVDGITLENGVSVPDIIDGFTKKCLLQNAKKVICIADSSKFGNNLLYCIAPLSKIDLIITDSNLDKKTFDLYTKNHISIITV